MPVIFKKTTVEKYAESFPSLHFVNGKTMNSKILSSLMDDSCRHNIGEGYIKETKQFVFKNKDRKLEMVVIFTDPTKHTKNTVAGFIVLEQGECKKLPDVYSIRLICSKKKLGKVLMGLALYSIICNATDKRCILEIADGYMNMGAFCMYSKFGFQQQIDLYGTDCFSDFSNLPMMVDLTSQTKENIIDIANGTSAGYADPFCTIDKNKQVYLAIALMLKNYVELGVLAIQQNNKFKTLFSIIRRRGVTIDELIETIKTKNIHEFEHFFSSISTVALNRPFVSPADSDFTISPASISPDISPASPDPKGLSKTTGSLSPNLSFSIGSFSPKSNSFGSFSPNMSFSPKSNSFGSFSPKSKTAKSLSPILSKTGSGSISQPKPKTRRAKQKRRSNSVSLSIAKKTDLVLRAFLQKKGKSVP